MVSHQPGAAADTAAAVAVKRARNSRKPKSSSGKVRQVQCVSQQQDLAAALLVDCICCAHRPKGVLGMGGAVTFLQALLAV